MSGATMRDLGGPLDCPHKPGTPEHAEWMRTWARREMAVRSATGQASADTNAMKATARIDFEAAGYDRPDPVLEILGPDAYGQRPYPSTTVVWPPRVKWGSALAQKASRHMQPVTIDVVIDGSQLAAALEALAEHMVTALGATVNDSLKAIERVTSESALYPRRTGQLQRSIPPSARVHGGGKPGDRRRHGNAAVCPIHGATKGGICRRCAR